jgi:hypothetical protein
MSIFSFLPRLTLKSASTLAKEESKAKEVARLLGDSNRCGINSVIAQKQSEVDEYAKRVAGFLNDVELHFERFGIGRYLSKEFTVYTKFEEPTDNSPRRLGLKWFGECTGDDNLSLIFSIAFSYIESENGIRIDYVGLITAARWSDKGNRKEINDNYDPDMDNIYVKKSNYVDKSQSTRVFKTHEDFMKAGSVPAWFIEMLGAYVKPIQG